VHRLERQAKPAVAGVAERRTRPEPQVSETQAALAGRAHLVVGAVGDHLAFELGKANDDVQRQAPHGVAGVELLRRRHEPDALGLEQGEQLREVEERAAQAVDLVDDHHVDLAGLDVREQALQRRSFDVAAGEAAVVVALGQRLPALVAHGADVELRRVK